MSWLAATASRERRGPAFPHTPLCSGENQKRFDIVCIGGSESGDICRSRFAGIDQTCTAPCETGLTELDGEHIAHHARKTAIAVGKGMYCYEPMTESHGNFVG